MKNQKSKNWNDWNEWNEHTERLDASRLDAQHDAQQAAEKAAAAEAKVEARREKLERRERRDARRADNEMREKREKRARRKARHEEREARRAENERREQEQAVARTARSLAAMENEKRERENTERKNEGYDTGSNNGMCGLQEASPTDIDQRQPQAIFRPRTSSHMSPFHQPQFHQYPQPTQPWQSSAYNQNPEYDQPFHSSAVHYDHYHQPYPELSEYDQPFHSPYPHYYHQQPQYHPSLQNPYNDFDDTTSNNEYQHQYPRPSHNISPKMWRILSRTSQPPAPPPPMNPTLPTQPRPQQPSSPTHSNIANSNTAPSIPDSRGEVDNMGKAQLVVDKELADTAQAEKEETVDLDVVLPDAEDSAVVDDMTVVEHMALVEDVAETKLDTDIGSEDTPTHINTDQTTTIAAFSVAVSFLNVKTRGEMIHPVDTVHLTKDGGCNAIGHTDSTDTTQDDCQVDTTNLTIDVADSFPNVKNRGEMIPLDTVLLTKDGGSKVHDCPADCYIELYNLLAKDMRRDIDLHADELVRLQISQLDSDSIDNYIDHPGCTDTTLAFFTDTGASEAGESIYTCLGTTDFDFKYEFEEPQIDFESYMKSSFDNIDPELSLTAPDAFHAYEFDFDPHILTTGPEAFRAYAHSLDETIYYTAHVRAGVT